MGLQIERQPRQLCTGNEPNFRSEKPNICAQVPLVLRAFQSIVLQTDHRSLYAFADDC